jgi:thioesterase domain-containing protein
MSIAELLFDLRRRDIRVWAEGDQLRCDAPWGALTPDLRDRLRQCKSEVLEFLRTARRLARQERAIVPLQQQGSRPAVFASPGHNGDVFCYRALARHMGEDQPFFGLEPPGLDGHSAPLTRVEDLAAYFAAQIRAFQPEGPYVIAGYCAGGTVAFELGRQLDEAGADVRLVALFGSPYPSWYRVATQRVQRLVSGIERIGMHVRQLAVESPEQKRLHVAGMFQRRKADRDAARADVLDEVLVRRRRVEETTLAAVRRYTPRFFAGRIGLFLPCKDWPLVGGAARRWQAVAQRTEEYCGTVCDGYAMLGEPYAATFAELFRRSIEKNEPDAAPVIPELSDAPYEL